MEILDSLHADYWAVQVLITILFTLITSRIINKILDKLQKKSQKTQSFWDDTLVSSLRKPLYFLVITLGITFCAQIIYSQFDIALLSIVSSIRDLFIITLIGWFLIRIIKETQKHLINSKLESDLNISRSTIDGVSTVSKVTVILVMGLIALQTFGFKIGGILALGGVGGIAVGFAAKDLLSNFFGGLMIYFDHPFEVGDWVRSPDKKIEGTVVKIGWRQTQIKTFDHRPLYVPNSVFSTIVVENPSRMTNRRIYETIGVRYDDLGKIDKIIKDVRTMFSQSNEIDQNQTIIVNVNKFATSSVDFFVYASTVTTNWVDFHRVKQDILLEIANIIEANKAEIAFPTSNITLKKESEDLFMTPGT